jgi:hypothetical protein
MPARRILAAALFASFAIAACSGAGGQPTPTPENAPAASPAPTGPPVASPAPTGPPVATPTAATAPTPEPSTAQPSAAAASGRVIGDVCAMFETAELEALTGHAFVGKTTDGIIQGETGCIWSFESPTPGITWDLVLSFLTVDAATLFEESKPYAATGTPLPDVGVDNYPSGGNIIYALKDDVMITVQYVNLSDDANREQVPAEVLRRALATLS